MEQKNTRAAVSCYIFYVCAQPKGGLENPVNKAVESLALKDRRLISTLHFQSEDCHEGLTPARECGLSGEERGTQMQDGL